jgi:uncharacterized protein
MRLPICDMQLFKFNRLRKILNEYGSCVIAYSGGVDSTFLLKTAYDILGEKVLAVTAVSQTYPKSERDDAEKFAKLIGAKQIFIDTDELNNPNFRANPANRCFYCKEELFTKLNEIAKAEGLNYVFDGSNADDVNDFRPGREAGQKLGIKSPLKEAGLTKDEIRILSKELGLPSWNKPSYACLSSRFPYGTEIDEENLRKIEEAEEFIHSLGFKQVRLRHHGNIARLEFNTSDFPVLFANGLADKISDKLKSLGYTYVTLDLQGYRAGSMNEVL